MSQRFLISIVFLSLLCITAKSIASNVYSSYLEYPNQTLNDVQLLDVSPDENFILFRSAARELEGVDSSLSTNYLDLYLVDLKKQSTIKVTMNSNGESANGNSYNASFINNGNKILFITNSKNLVDGNNGNQSLLLYDVETASFEKVDTLDNLTWASNAKLNYFYLSDDKGITKVSTVDMSQTAIPLSEWDNCNSTKSLISLADNGNFLIKSCDKAYLVKSTLEISELYVSDKSLTKNAFALSGNGLVVASLLDQSLQIIEVNTPDKVKSITLDSPLIQRPSEKEANHTWRYHDYQFGNSKFSNYRNQIAINYSGDFIAFIARPPAQLNEVTENVPLVAVYSQESKKFARTNAGDNTFPPDNHTDAFPAFYGESSRLYMRGIHKYDVSRVIYIPVSLNLFAGPLGEITIDDKSSESPLNAKVVLSGYGTQRVLVERKQSGQDAEFFLDQYTVEDKFGLIPGTVEYKFTPCDVNWVCNYENQTSTNVEVSDFNSAPKLNIAQSSSTNSSEPSSKIVVSASIISEADTIKITSLSDKKVTYLDGGSKNISFSKDIEEIYIAQYCLKSHNNSYICGAQYSSEKLKLPSTLDVDFKVQLTPDHKKIIASWNSNNEYNYKLYKRVGYNGEYTLLYEGKESFIEDEDFSLGDSFSYKLVQCLNEICTTYNSKSIFAGRKNQLSLSKIYADHSYTELGVYFSFDSDYYFDEYKVYKESESSERTLVATQNGRNTTYTDTDSDVFEEINYYVTACYQDICQSAITTYNLNPPINSMPQAPSYLKATTDKHHAATVLEWDKVAKVDGYRLFLINDSSNRIKQQLLIEGNETTSYVHRFPTQIGEKQQFKIQSFVYDNQLKTKKYYSQTTTAPTLSSIDSLSSEVISPTKIRFSHTLNPLALKATFTTYIEHDYYVLESKSSLDNEFNKSEKLTIEDQWGRRQSYLSISITPWEPEATTYQYRIKGCSNHLNKCSAWSDIFELDTAQFSEPPFVTTAPTAEILANNEIKITANIPQSSRIYSANIQVKWSDNKRNYSLEKFQQDVILDNREEYTSSTLSITSRYCIDNWNNCSEESEITTLEIPEDFLQRPASNIRLYSSNLKLTTVDNKAAVEFSATLSKEGVSYVEIYRSKNSEPLSYYSKVEPETEYKTIKFTDVDVSKGDVIRYQFKLCNSIGCGNLTSLQRISLAKDSNPPVAPKIAKISELGLTHIRFDVAVNKNDKLLKVYLGTDKGSLEYSSQFSINSASVRNASLSTLLPSTDYFIAFQTCKSNDNCSELSTPFKFTTDSRYRTSAQLTGIDFRNLSNFGSVAWTGSGGTQAYAGELDTYSGRITLNRPVNISEGASSKSNVILKVGNYQSCSILYTHKTLLFNKSRTSEKHSRELYRIVYTGRGCNNEKNQDQYSLYIESDFLDQPYKIEEKDLWLDQWLNLNLEISSDGLMTLQFKNESLFTTTSKINQELFKYASFEWNSERNSNNFARISGVEVLAETSQIPAYNYLGSLSAGTVHPTAIKMRIGRDDNNDLNQEITFKYALYSHTSNSYSDIETLHLAGESNIFDRVTSGLRASSSYDLLSTFCIKQDCLPYTPNTIKTSQYSKITDIREPSINPGLSPGELEISIWLYGNGTNSIDTLTFFYKAEEETEYTNSQQFDFPGVHATDSMKSGGLQFIIKDLTPGQGYQFKAKACNVLGCYEELFESIVMAPIDTDKDGTIDHLDAFPNDPLESQDTDDDGIGNNADKDDDNDGLPDAVETELGLNPLSYSDANNDLDEDGFSNIYEFSLGFDMNNSNLNPSVTGIFESFEPTTTALSFEGFIGIAGYAYDQTQSLVNFAYKGENTTTIISYNGMLKNGKLGFAMSTIGSTTYDISINGVSVPSNLHNIQYDKASRWTIVTVDVEQGESEVKITLNTTSGYPSRTYLDALYIPAVTPITVNDFNSDGKSDILYRSENDLSWRLDLIDSFNVHSSITDLAMSNCCGWLFNGIGDFNADGFNDVIVRNVSSGKWYIYNLDGLQVVSKGYVPLESAINVGVQAIADFNNDGYSDVLIRNEQTGEWKIALLNNRTVVEEITPPMSTVLGWKIVDTKDFDGNGSADILIRNESSGAWYMYLYDNTNIISRGYVSTLPDDLNVDIYGVGDFDADGKYDLLSRNKETNEWVIWYMNGKELKHSLIAPFSTADSWEFNSVGDYNGDGFTDVAIRNKSSDKVHIYLWDGESVISKDYLDLLLDDDYKAKSLVH